MLSLLALVVGFSDFTITPGFTVAPAFTVEAANPVFVIEPADEPKPDKDIAPFPVPVPEPKPIDQKTKDCVCGDACTCDPCVCAEPKDASVKVGLGNFSCTGTCIAYHNNKSLVITVSHLLRRADGRTYHPVGTKVYAEAEDGTKYDGRILLIHPTVDLALLEIDGKFPVATVSMQEPTPNTRVRQWGYNWRSQGRRVYKEGVVIQISNFNNIMDSTIDQISGESGVGVFNEKNELVAVAWGGAAVGPNGQPNKGQSSTRLNIIRPFLAKVKDRFPGLKSRLTDVSGKKELRNLGSANVKAPAGWYKNYDNAVREAVNTGKPLVVVFSVDEGCTYCDIYKRGALSDPSLLDAAVCVYVTPESYPKLFEDMQIGSYPTTHICTVNKEAKLYSQKSLSGAVQLSELKAAINTYK